MSKFRTLVESILTDYIYYTDDDMIVNKLLTEPNPEIYVYRDEVKKYLDQHPELVDPRDLADPKKYQDLINNIAVWVDDDLNIGED